MADILQMTYSNVFSWKEIFYILIQISLKIVLSLLVQLTMSLHMINSTPPGQNCHHFSDNIFLCIVVNEKFYFLIKIH